MITHPINNRIYPIAATCLCIIGICSLISMSIKITDKIIIAASCANFEPPFH